eukprot:GHVL01030351.1.p1 GENE.GHVL01030351.1~~GHVL01030351.1.p1  ORF type:complete len:222 (+),score=2.84 GHVL01030351.1:446-1111(+)
MSYAYNDLAEVMTLDDLSKRRRRDIYTTFWNSGLHGQDWPCDVFCVTTCRVDDDKCRFVSKNNPDWGHAETIMVDYLREMLHEGSLGPNQTITLYLNYSPCRRCSDVLSELLEEDLYGYDVSLDVVVAGLYKIIRPSCRSSPDHEYHQFHSWGTHWCQATGLQNLDQAGVGLRTINSQGRQDWNTLTKHVLGVKGFQYKGSNRQREDWNLDSDLDEILGYY